MELFMFVLYYHGDLYVYTIDREGNFYYKSNQRTSGENVYKKNGTYLAQWIIKRDYDALVHVDDELIPAFEEAHKKHWDR